MQKIFELSSQDFIKGLAISSQYPSSGIFIDALGINPFINPYSDSSDMGLLQTNKAPTNIAGAVVVDSVLGSALDGANYRMYSIGDSGNFYEQNTSSDDTPTNLRSGANVITSPAEGVTIYQSPTGTRYLYYAREAYIGRWDLSGSYPTGWSDTFAGSGGSGFAIILQTTTIRNFHHFVGNVYFTDKNYIGGILDDGSGEPTITSQLLDLPKNLTAVDIDDDGYYLVIAATENQITGNRQINTLNKIYFWDTVSNSWQKEWSINTACITSIHKMGSTMYAVCADGIYAFNFATPPTLVVPLSTSDSPSKTGGVNPTSHGACVKDGVLYWITAGGAIAAFGSPVPGMAPRFFKPFKTFTADGSTTLLISVGKYRFYTADSNEYGYVDNTTGGATGLTAETIFIPLGKKWQIKRIEIILGEPMASGDELNIDLKSDEDTSASDYGTLSYAVDGAVRSKTLYGSFTVENLKTLINFVGGNVKVKKMTFYGEPVTIV